MNKVCDKCKKAYDDAKQSTVCNHADLLPSEDFTRKDAAYHLNGKTVKVKSSGRTGTVTSMDWDGYLAVDGEGKFDPSELEEQRKEPDYSKM